MKKRFIVLLVAMLLTLSSLTPAMAASNEPDTDPNPISTRWEELEWYVRVRNGVTQIRCWSVTYMYWVTEWTNLN